MSKSTSAAMAAAVAVVFAAACNDAAQITQPESDIVANALDGAVLSADVDVTIPGPSLAVVSSGTAATCADILIYDHNTRFAHARQAVADLGLPFTRAVSGDFNALITGQTWDLVIMDLPSNEPGPGWRTNLIGHIQAGGLAIHTMWQPANTAALLAAFEVSNPVIHQTQTFYQWNAHPLYSTPNSVTPVFDVWADIFWADNGFKVQPTGSAVAAAGFTAAPTAGQAAIVIGNDGRTIFNGFLFDDYEPADKEPDGQKDIEELIQNQVELVCNLLITVEIDIKPGSDPNCFNNDGNGVIPVAILGAADFDVTQIDPSTVQLEGLSVASKGKSGKLMAHVEDVNGDGLDDLVVQIEDVDGTFASGSSTATLTGDLFDGTPFEGSDDICVVPPAPPDEEAPVISDLQPPDETPTFVWNPDLGVDYSYRPTDLTRLCPSTEPFDCESLMFEAVDLGTGVEDGSCGTECADDDFDGNLIDVVILDSPGDVYNGASLLTNNAGLGPDMFQAFFCGDNFAPPNGGAMCDGSDDGTYAVRILASDKTQPENNVATLDYSFVLDTNPPVIGFGGITGLNASNAATVDFVLDASVVDRNGDGTSVTSAIVQITGITGGGDCSLGAEDLVTETQVQVTPEGGNDDATGNTVIADVTAEVQANSGDFDWLFTAANLGAGSYTYCFEIVADDGAKRKDGFDDDLSVSAVAAKDFTWQ